MECKTCKEKSNKRKLPGEKNLEINLIPKSIQEGEYNGNFFFKIIAFVVVAIAIPFIILVLLGQIFMTFFLPKSLPKVTKKFKGFFINLFNIYGKFRHDREIKKRQRQFEKNVNYVEELEKEESVEKVDKVKSDFDNIEIFENKK
jgi:hypothetical protein